MAEPEQPEPEIIVQEIRLPTEAEKQLEALFDKFAQESLDNLEKGARELIQLVTALFSVIFGILALGGEAAAGPLRLPSVLAPAAISLAALLLTLLAALDVIVPGAYWVRKQSLSDREAAYTRMLERKSAGLRAAVVFFGIGLTAFAALIGALLYVRWVG